MPLDIMNNSHSDSSDRFLNGSVRRPSPTPTSLSSGAMVGMTGRPMSLMDTSIHNSSQNQIVQVVIHKDENGYGMKVSGDNPVYVQSVKEDGAAERAGLHSGDKIIKVNGVNVTQATHTEVVALIKASSHVALTVQQRTSNHKTMGSPSVQTRHIMNHPTQRITSPQPVTHEKQFQLQLEREQQIRLMIEKEQRFIDQLRSEIAITPNEKKNEKLIKAESNLQKLHTILQNHIRSQNEQTPCISHLIDTLDSFSPLPATSIPSSSVTLPARSTKNQGKLFNAEVPPPLPKRSHSFDPFNKKLYTNGNKFLNLNAVPEPGGLNDIRKNFTNKIKSSANSNAHIMISNSLYSDISIPPPLPPRANSNAGSIDSDAVNSINKQMSYPLVATCTTLINNYPSTSRHQRTRSSPDSLSLLISPAEACRRLIASESMSDLYRSENWEMAATPPGTPPPPYPSPSLNRKFYSNRNSVDADEGDVRLEEKPPDSTSIDRSSTSSLGILGRVLANTSPIHAATSQTAQQPIISMEDDEISDPEVGQLEDHGPFKSLSRLLEHTPHLAVFLNYVLSNSDPSSLLFYLITDLYKEGNAKEMRKWAFEIHSSFLVPGAPLRLSNVDENIAREIDDVLIREFDKEEILRKIFWKARNRAKEELTKQLADFQQKRTAGLGTIFGPNDSELSTINQDKVKELKLYESILLDKLEPFLEELDKENYDQRRYLTAAALATVITRVFGVRPAGHALDRCPTFVNKEKSFRTKFIGRYSRKLTLQGHPFVAQPYYTVILCNHCHQIIFGIAPQGYQCSACLINLHRLCTKLYDDVCPGPINKRDRGIGKLMDRIHSRDHRRKPSSHFIQMEKERRLAEERDLNLEHDFSGETKPTNPVTRTGSDRRPDAVREEAGRTQENVDQNDKEPDSSQQDSTISLPAYTGNKKKPSTNISRSESVKEQSEKRKQRRNISDPLHSTKASSENSEVEDQGLPFQTNSGSSSNSSLSSSRSLESPSASLDAVSGLPLVHPAGTGWDSDLEVEVDPPDWQSPLSENELSSLDPQEKKRQDVINELFHTERSHVRNLRVLEFVFRKPLHSSKILKHEEINLIFPNLCELLEIHSQLNASMKSKRKETPLIKDVGDILLNMFDGSTGENFQSLAAAFCERQQLALEFIKERRKKDSRFDSCLSECEKNNLCRRLPLQGILPTEMQRLSKYPLLLERLIAIEEKRLYKEPEYVQLELCKLKLAHDRSKEILNYVNQAAKIACNRARLEEIQRHLDTSIFEKTEHTIVNEFKNLDLTRYNLIHEGTMHLRRPNKQPVAVHIVLLEEAVILLQKDAERYLLKFFQAGSTTQQPLAPIIKTSTLLVRANAASKSSLFLVNTSSQNSQMYDLLARDSSERDIWFKHISDAAEAYNRREGKSKRSEPTPDTEESEILQELPNPRDVSERAEAVGGDANPGAEVENGDGSVDTNNRNNNINDDDKDKQTSPTDSETPNDNDNIPANGLTLKVTADDWPLVQPTEVLIAIPPVHTAEPVFTPIELIRRKDEEIRKALLDKEGLVADLLCIPREDYHLIADLASEETISKNLADREPTELVLAAIFQAHQLQSAMNDSLNLTETDVMLSAGMKYASCSSNENLLCKHDHKLTSLPVHKFQEIASTLSSQLTTLLSIVKQRDEERDRLRKELQRTREQLHEKLALHGPQNTDCGNPEPTQPSDLESIQESPIENDTN